LATSLAAYQAQQFSIISTWRDDFGVNG